MSNKNVPCEASKNDLIGLLPCSGACNVGMLTTRNVVTMADKFDNINFVCALGLPLGIKGIINNARKSDFYIAVNGCKVMCSTKALNSINIKPDINLILTEDLGIQKNANYTDNTDLDKLNKKLEEDIVNLY